MHNINDIDKKYIDKYLNDILENKTYLQTKNYTQHGRVSIYEHAINVAATCLKMNEFFHLNANLDILLRAAFLHDFILYDWHNKDEAPPLHGFAHAKIASNNAKKYFNINDETASAIESHMWPLNITKVPKSKEAIILCLSDKYCAIIESLFMR